MVIRRHRSNYPTPIAFAPGDALELGERSAEYPGWIWVTDAAGRRGWAPETFVARKEGNVGVALREYTARELDTEEGQHVACSMELDGWVWVETATGESGWIPEATVRGAEEDGPGGRTSMMGEAGTMEQPIAGAVEHVWYARPVFFVQDLGRALRFYIDDLGFVKKWHAADGAGTVCQVDRGGCEIILCEDETRADRGRLFLELSREGVERVLHDVEERSVPTERSWWGYDVLRVADPDGNELLVCMENLLPERVGPAD